jgi:tetratricopeptide (TPR) repeat protein
MTRARYSLAPLCLLLASCSSDPRVVAKKYVDNGNKYFTRGKYKEASIMYRRALSKDMKHPDAWYRLGLANMKLALYGEARRDFARAMELDPSNTDAIATLGDLDVMFYALDPVNNKALMADLKDITQQLLKKDPKSYDGLRFSAAIALLQRDLKTAIAKFQAARQVKPQKPELLLVLVQTLFVDGQVDPAEKLAKEVIAQQPTYGPMYDVLYSYYVRTNRLELGEELLKRKIESNPAQRDYLLQLAFHYYMTNRRPEMTSTVARITSNRDTFGDSHMQVGDFYLRIGDFENALAQYDQGQKENPKVKNVYQKKMVEVLGTQGKNDQAFKLLATVLKADPKDPEAAALHATLTLQAGGKSQAKAAIAELHPLVTKLPGNPMLHYDLGRAYQTVGDQPGIEQARVQYQEALKIDPKYTPAILSLAELELMRGDYEKAVQAAETVLNGDETNLNARMIRASGLINLKDYDRARQELTTVLRMYPGANNARYQLAQLNLLERRYAEAESGFQTLLQANDPRGLPGLLEAKVQEGHWDQAIEFVDGLLKKSPDRPEYRAALATIYARAGKNTESAVQYQTLIDKNPKSPDLYLRLGESKVRLGDFAGAIAAFLKARELAPDDVAARLDLGLVYDHTGRYEEARKLYEEVVKLQPDNGTALNNLAYLKADEGVDLDQALAYAQRAQQKMPNDLNVIDTLGLIYLKKNLTDDGLRMLQDLVNRKPENATYHLHLALALYQKGNRPLARRELEAALRNKPSEKEQGKIKELLAKVG